MRYPLRFALAGVPLLLAAACAHRSEPPALEAPAPAAWQRVHAQGSVEDAWLTRLGDIQLTTLAEQAITANYSLAQAAARVEQSRQTLRTASAGLWPTLSTNVGGSRRRNVINFTGEPLPQSVTAENFSSGASLQWQLDLWGELRGAARSAAYTYAAEEARFVDARRQLVADTARAWYTLLEQRAALAVARERLTNAEESFAIVERSYRLGLGEALDLYQARATVAAQRGNVANTEAALKRAAAALDLLVADYP
ncbi:MAG: TolC family protein, partial [Pseudomonadota bacterium]